MGISNNCKDALWLLSEWVVIVIGTIYVELDCYSATETTVYISPQSDIVSWLRNPCMLNRYAVNSNFIGFLVDMMKAHLPHLGDYTYHYIHQDIPTIYHTRVITPTITSIKIYRLSTALGWLCLSLHPPRYTDYLPHSGEYAYHYIHQDIPTIYRTRMITPTITSTKIYWLSTTLGWLCLPLHPPRYTDYLPHSGDYAYHYIH